jgi:integrase
MHATPSRKSKRGDIWPRQVSVGRVSVSIYRRTSPGGHQCFMVANYAEGKRRFDSYAGEAEALEAAARLARQMSERDTIGATMTREQSLEWAAAEQVLKPLGISVAAAASTVAECLKDLGDGLPSLHAAVSFYKARHKQVTKKPVAEVVAELLKIKEARGASPRYMQDLRYRLNRFAAAFQKDACNITTAVVQEWLDGQKLSPQGYTNFRRVIHLLFKFAVARGYAADNPVAEAERIKVRNGDIEIFTPLEIARLLAVASPEFLPSLAISAFAGLRSAEVERLEWKDVDLAGRMIVIGASRSKTASRRIVPLCDNLAAWLAPYAGRQGKVWPGGHDAFYVAQQDTAQATAVEAKPDKGIVGRKAVEWKANALRHSYASYRFALTGDAGRVAGECGNSAAVIHRHYRELVKPADAERWFNVRPEAAANVLPMPVAAVANP